jgi:hypothetical protein
MKEQVCEWCTVYFRMCFIAADHIDVLQQCRVIAADHTRLYVHTHRCNCTTIGTCVVQSSYKSQLLLCMLATLRAAHYNRDQLVRSLKRAEVQKVQSTHQVLHCTVNICIAQHMYA